MAENCVFCKIVAGEIPATVVAENANAIAFRDIEPKAAIHDLVVPKTHIADLREIDQLPAGALDDLFGLINQVAEQEGIVENGYRVITNIGEGAGQTVFHLHWHILSGDNLPGF